jgi:hypothetical protein
VALRTAYVSGYQDQYDMQLCGMMSAGEKLYLGDFSLVRQVNEQTGRLTTAVGTGSMGVSSAGAPSTSLTNSGACQVSVDDSGNVLITYTGSVWAAATQTGHFYGKAMRAGHAYPVAGNGTHGYPDRSGVRATRLPMSPTGLTPESDGNLVIVNNGFIPDRSPRQRTPDATTPARYPRGTRAALLKVVAASDGTFYGQAMTAGDIYAVAGNGTLGTSGSGVPGTQAELSRAEVTVDQNGNLVISGAGNIVRVVAASTGTFYGQAMTAGYIYTVAGDGTQGYAGDGGPATSAELDNAVSTTVDSAGNLLINDNGNNRVRVVAASTGTSYGQPMTAGDIYTVAGNGTLGVSGDGGPATSAEVNVAGMGLDGAGNLLDNYGGLFSSAPVNVQVAAAVTGTFYGRAMTAGHIYTVAGGSTKGPGNGGLATRAQLGGVWGLAVDQHGNLVLSDRPFARVRVVAAVTGTFYGRAMTAGHIYTVAGDGEFGDDGEFSSDGRRATGTSVEPLDVAVDAAGNLVIDSDGEIIRVVAAGTGTFYGQAMTAGHIYTVVGTGKTGFSGDGGPATSATFRAADGVAVDGAGNLVIADTQNYRVRVVATSTGTFYGQAMTAGDIYTVAGGGTDGLGDGGPATSAELIYPDSVAVDAAGNLVINNRVVAAQSGTFYGIAMTAGDIYTVAGGGPGGGTDGLGDGGPATSALLSDGDVAACARAARHPDAG